MLTFRLYHLCHKAADQKHDQDGKTTELKKIRVEKRRIDIRSALINGILFTVDADGS